MNEKLIYKKFEENDINLLFEWANEEECRKNSFDTSPIMYEDHLVWCKDQLTSNIEDIFIIYLENTPVALLRLKYEGNKALISYSVDKQFRGQGLGYKIIDLIEQEHVYRKKCEVLIAKVKNNNTASQNVFERCYYKKYVEDNHYVYIKKIQEG